MPLGLSILLYIPHHFQANPLQPINRNPVYIVFAADPDGHWW